MLIFESKQIKFERNLKISLSCKILYPTESVKCLRVKVDTSLSWQCHINDLSIKLNSMVDHNCHGNNKKIKKISQIEKFCSNIKKVCFHISKI